MQAATFLAETFLTKNWENFAKHHLLSPHENKDKSALVQKCMLVWKRVEQNTIPFLFIGPGAQNNREWTMIFGLLENQQKEGAILAAKPWFLLLNDFFIYAGICSNKEFILPYGSFEKISQARLWSEEENCPTTFGRELLLISLSDYTYHCHESLNICLSPTKEHKIDSLSGKQKRIAAISRKEFFSLLKTMILNKNDFKE